MIKPKLQTRCDNWDTPSQISEIVYRTSCMAQRFSFRLLSSQEIIAFYKSHFIHKITNHCHWSLFNSLRTYKF